ncbi:fasciclin domain-containing protein [Sphaerisporangium sp. NPDC005289]|uniref:fasciclin domain-containing protein n=1 Tax=Sphaerisporangium sp. NPDC005289 TaxID=3155247 RepID=UPI0033A8684D
MNTRLLVLPLATALSFTAASVAGAGATTSGRDAGAGTLAPGAVRTPVPSPVSPTSTFSTPPGSPSGSPGSPIPSESPSGSPSEGSPSPTAPAASPSGPGCASLPTSGPGSPAQLAGEPLATAVSHIPDLSTLADAAKKAGAVETLNSAKDITVFAPTNSAFNKVPQDQLNRIIGNRQQLTRLLTFHVVQGRKTPADLENGPLTSLEGGKLTVGKSDDTYKVNNAKVTCGPIQTRNATVYIIDSVLKPGG